MHFKVAEATARLVLAAAARNPGRRHRRWPGGPPKASAAHLVVVHGTAERVRGRAPGQAPGTSRMSSSPRKSARH